ncbi:ATP-binding protein [Streptomyces sp. SID9124]|uniref:ATP-binding protein n=1 Tax=Streptomyces sp. SID9124 TaxID=2706108 RepID=UPI0013DF0F51|nr:ATP-binding protein [Streptomyces sp. SID9124]NED15435.1 ATP-binding protein [Streptomyces sp. SID9124]
MTRVPPQALPFRHVLTLPTTGSAVRVARETAEDVLVECGVGLRHPSTGRALLILSELVTNAVRHAGPSPTITVTYAHGPGIFAFGVHDRHPYRPPLVGAAVAPGSGLATVVETTAELGGTAVTRGDADAGGKSIWITLPL